MPEILTKGQLEDVIKRNPVREGETDEESCCFACLYSEENLPDEVIIQSPECPLKNCPFCGGDKLSIENCITLEDCANFERCEEDSYVTVVCDYSKGGCGVSGGYRKTCEEAIAAWNRRVDRWIPVSEGKPYEKSCHYLVLSKMNMAHGGTWEDNDGDARRNMYVAYFDCTGKFNIPYVTHWQPLPKPPEGVKRNE